MLNESARIFKEITMAVLAESAPDILKRSFIGYEACAGEDYITFDAAGKAIGPSMRIAQIHEPLHIGPMANTADFIVALQNVSRDEAAQLSKYLVELYGKTISDDGDSFVLYDKDARKATLAFGITFDLPDRSGAKNHPDIRMALARMENVGRELSGLPSLPLPVTLPLEAGAEILKRPNVYTGFVVSSAEEALNYDPAGKIIGKVTPDYRRAVDEVNLILALKDITPDEAHAVANHLIDKYGEYLTRRGYFDVAYNGDTRTAAISFGQGFERADGQLRGGLVLAQLDKMESIGLELGGKELPLLFEPASRTIFPEPLAPTVKTGPGAPVKPAAA